MYYADFIWYLYIARRKETKHLKSCSIANLFTNHTHGKIQNIRQIQ